MNLDGLLGRRNLAVLAAAAIVGAVGIGGVMTAQADNGSGTTNHSTRTDQGEGDGETDDDATDTGPDANPNEPGHQDASDATDGEQEDSEADEQGVETDDDGADGETNDDANDTGPDANPNEPGHQDASDVPGSSD